MNDVAPVLGVLAGVIGVVGMIPYLRDTVRRSTRPHRGTWLIWGVLATVVCLSQRADGGSWSLIMAGTGAVMAGLVLVLALRFGTGGVSAWDSRADHCSPARVWRDGSSSTNRWSRRSASSSRI